ncbi:unnamed protein product [Schistosoma mattheei]|uniref:Uncharacterized protein n=1 Tax=Schistosoma mattheei TaxID=31246 RepID=A0A3P7Z555_9TREM|nr:unnamed protein product [Schistosoma mattheei]
MTIESTNCRRTKQTMDLALVSLKLNSKKPSELEFLENNVNEETSPINNISLYT